MLKHATEITFRLRRQKMRILRRHLPIGWGEAGRQTTLNLPSILRARSVLWPAAGLPEGVALPEALGRECSPVWRLQRDLVWEQKGVGRTGRMRKALYQSRLLVGKEIEYDR